MDNTIRTSTVGDMQGYCPYCMSQVKDGEPCPVCGLTAGSYKPKSKHLPAGTVLRERYLVGRVLGEGGFGITYIGRDLVLGLKVAVKEYFPTDKASRDCSVSTEVESFLGTQNGIFQRGKDRFLQEARTMAKLVRLPNIVGVRDFFEENATAYIVMDYIDGTTLSDMVKQRGGVLPAWELLHIIEPLFDSLSAMHELHLIHRDISPDNVMLEHGVVKLLDFGCARESADGDATMTIMLRHGYAPLEQYQSASGAQGPWTDVYALAATIYFCITGKKPPQAMDRLFEDGLVPPRKLGAELTARQEAALLHALLVRPKARYQSVQEFHSALYDGAPIEDNVNVVFDANGGTPIEDMKKPRGVALDLTACVTTRDRYKFTGWFLDRELTSPAVSPLTLDGDTTLYAGWEAVRSTVPIWKRRPVQIAAAAVVALAIIGGSLALLPHGNQPSDIDDGPTDDGPVENDPPDPGDVGGSGDQTPDTPPSGQQETGIAVTIPMLRSMLENDRYSDIVFNSVGEVNLTEPLTITKPVTFERQPEVSGDLILRVNAPLIIESTLTLDTQMENCSNIITVNGPEGRLHCRNGSFYGSGILRTRNGGVLDFTGDGWADLDVLWLDRGKAIEGENFGLDQQRYFTLDEDATFESAAYVSDFNSLENVLNDRRVESVVIDGDIDIPYYVQFSKPVRISQGVTVTAEDNSGIELSSTLLNEGTLRGHISGDAKWLINYGDMSLYTQLYGDEMGVINLGSYEIGGSGSSLDGGLLVNYGRIKGADTDNTDIIHTNVYNYGEIDLTEQQTDFMVVSMFQNFGGLLVGACPFNCFGVMQLAGGSYMYLDNTLRLSGPGTMEIAPGVSFEPTAKARIEGGVVMAPGNIKSAITYPQSGQEDTREQIFNNLFSSTRLVESCAWADFDDGMNVNTYMAFINEQGNFHVTKDLVIDYDKTVTGNMGIYDGVTLQINGNLTISGGRLSISGGHIIVNGELKLVDGAQAHIYGDNALDMRGGALVLENYSEMEVYGEINLNGNRIILTDSFIYDSNNIHEVGELNLYGNSVFTGPCDVNFAQGGSLNVNDNSAFSSQNWNMTAQNVTIGPGSVFCSNNLNIYDGEVFENHGDMYIVPDGVQINGGAKFSNTGNAAFDMWHNDGSYCDGEMENSGELDLHGYFRLSGSLENTGTVNEFWGEFNNFGYVSNRGTFNYGRSPQEYVALNQRGEWKGNRAVNRQNG